MAEAGPSSDTELLVEPRKAPPSGLDRLLIRPRRATETGARRPDDAPQGAARRGRRSTFLIWLVTCLAFTLLGASWATATPYGQGYDEDGHILRAASVVYGQMYVPPANAQWDSGGWVRVPQSLVPPHRHCMFQSKLARPPASCLGAMPKSQKMVRAASTAARYNPIYYGLVGWPLRISPTMGGIIASRLVSAFLSAGLLAAAFAMAWRFRESWLLPAAVLLVSTPIEMNLAGTINPNSLEIAASVALWMALVVLARSRVLPRGRELRWVLGIATVAAIPVTSLRQMGPLLTLVAVVACAVAARPGRFREVIKLRPVRWIAAALTGVAVLSVIWSFVSGLMDTGAVIHRHVTTLHVLNVVVNDRAADWMVQLVGRFYGAFKPPDWTIYLWFLLIGVVILPGLLLGGRRLVVAVGGTLAFVAALSTTLEIKYFDALGPSQQGRYYLPMVTGAVLLAAAIPALQPRFAGRFALVAAVLTAPVHVICLAVMMTAWQHGYTSGLDMHPLSGVWQPITGSLAPLVLAVLGAAALIGVAAGWWWVVERSDHAGPLHPPVDEATPAAA